MSNKSLAARCAVGVIGGLMLAGVGVAAFADPSENGSGDVDVTVDIASTETGALSLTVAGTQTTLTETGSTASFRQFTGALPNVTVTDTREDVDAGVFWYVTGQASDFVGAAGQPSITPDHLGWTPSIVTANEGEVAEGDAVGTSIDGGVNNVGLVGQELLALALDSADAQAASGQWTATANLVLKTPVTVAPGSYTSTLTLSLFEDSY
ncbi:hypothetical protein SRABI76_02510 [Microbacterium oxydans]|uniref:WxL domain-containing protein n=1 Tax=Microbacterium oxydans TaxID=82380 RepID=A0A0F0LE63_9MICO|nr:hypothetical protein [Microbacterium oxydans]KJL30580.1 hypothetical protein RS83_00649 [Microbacterium oxydans]CAH0221192.1 hypothetical protein SRABI76_02510 [Microbacterium oxydans]